MEAARAVLAILALTALAACQAPCVTAEPDALIEQADDYYQCLDAQLNEGEGCGSDGYVLGYAGKYADRYMNQTYEDLSLDGQSFLDQTLICLQQALIDGEAETLGCSEVEALGFASHVPCYLEAGFCSLSSEDRQLIFETVDPDDWQAEGSQQAIGEILAACASEWAGG